MKKEIIGLNWFSKFMLKYLKIEFNAYQDPINIDILLKSVKDIKKEGFNPDFIVFKNDTIYIIDSNHFEVEIPRWDGTGSDWIGNIT